MSINPSKTNGCTRAVSQTSVDTPAFIRQRYLRKMKCLGPQKSPWHKHARVFTGKRSSSTRQVRVSKEDAEPPTLQREPGLEQSEPGRGAMVGGLALATRHTGTYLSHLLITIHHLTSSDADRRSENTEEKLKWGGHSFGSPQGKFQIQSVLSDGLWLHIDPSFPHDWATSCCCSLCLLAFDILPKRPD